MAHPGTVISECVVVGAGPAGVATSMALTHRGVDHVVLERGGIGHTWSSQRWDSFRLNTPGWMNPVLGEVAPGDYSTRADLLALLAKRMQGVPVRTQTPVTALRKGRAHLVLHTPDEELVTKTVVVASGAKNRPLWPVQAVELPSRVTSLHVADYRSAHTLPEGGVLVVGGGQSGAQVAEDLARAGRRVWFSTSRVGRYPAHYRGRELLAWHVECGWWSQVASQLPDPAAMWLPTPLLASNGRDIGLPALARLGVTLLGRVTAVKGGHIYFGGTIAEYVTYADQVAASLERIVDDYIAAAGIPAPAAATDDGRGPLDVPPQPTLDFDAAGVSTVIWCTGFGPELSWLPEPVLDRRGLPVLDNGHAAGLPGLWFVGMPWQSTRASAILHGMPLDIERAVAGVTAQLA